MSIELKNCPFCGKPGSVFVKSDTDHRSVLMVGCVECDVTFSRCYTPARKPVPAQVFYDTRDELIERWNHRVDMLAADTNMFVPYNENKLQSAFATHLKSMDMHEWIESKSVSVETVRHMYDANWLSAVGMLEVLQIMLPEDEYHKYVEQYVEVKHRTQKEVDEYTIANSKINLQKESVDSTVDDFDARCDWIATTENYMCDHCKEISPEPYKYCPNCKQFMRNHKTIK